MQDYQSIFQKKDIEKFQQGKHFDIYKIFGAHKTTHTDIEGIRFCVWAPNAKKVCLISEFNNWDAKKHIMQDIHKLGIWEIFVPNIDYGHLYKYEITTDKNELLIKTDPHAFHIELRPHNSSIIFNVDDFIWDDDIWLENRKRQTLNQPINIYEVHLESWQRGNDYFLNYRDLAHKLVRHLKENNYNYIELMPILEHPLDDSWGYQVSGFYAVTSRYGTPQDFQYFVNYMHKNNIGVILDWVPAHFVKDEFALAKFDGSFLYEHPDFKKGYHPQWDTLVFDYSKPQVRNFLIGSALYYFDKMHIDGLRVDAVSSMIYLDYGRKEGQWEVNNLGNNINLEAVSFLKELNEIIHKKHPDVFVIAEEATDYKGVTKDLGFDFKWNMGWMNDILNYFQLPSKKRISKQACLTFSLIYAFDEKFILPLSHDEVVHEKNSFFNKMPGSIIAKFSNLRLLYSYFICYPGKKLSFMGTEIAQENEWDFKSQISWDLLDKDLNKKFNLFVKDINYLYLHRQELFFDDFSYNGYEWIDFSTLGVISYLRKTKSASILCIHNFTDQDINNYLIKLKNTKNINIIFNSDLKKYGGNEKVDKMINISKDAIMLNIACFSTLLVEVK